MVAFKNPLGTIFSLCLLFQLYNAHVLPPHYPWRGGCDKNLTTDGGVDNPNTIPNDPKTSANTKDIDVKILKARNAPDVWLDCISLGGQWNLDIEDLCNIDCAAILCRGEPDVLTRNGSASGHNRIMSGASSQPYSGTDAELAALGLTRDDPAHVSAEEYPFASTSEGGTGDQGDDYTDPATWATTAGVDPRQQSIQGSRLNTALNAAGIPQGGQYRIRFNSNSHFCRALNSIPPDYSVCNEKNPSKDSPLVRMYHRDSKKYAKLHFSPVDV